MIHYPRNFFKKTPEKQNRTKVSEAAPEWFKVVTDEKNQKFDAIIAKNEETLSILSRYKSWITVTPKSKNRKLPLEKMKIKHFDETSRIMPNWMQIKAKKDKELFEMMRTAEYNSMRDVCFCCCCCFFVRFLIYFFLFFDFLFIIFFCFNFAFILFLNLDFFFSDCFKRFYQY